MLLHILPRSTGILVVLALLVCLVSSSTSGDGGHGVDDGFRTIELHHSLDLGRTWRSRGTAVCRAAATRLPSCSLQVSEPLGGEERALLEVRLSTASARCCLADRALTCSTTTPQQLSRSAGVVKLRVTQLESGTRGTPLLASISAVRRLRITLSCCC